MQRVHVVIGVIVNEKGQICIARRAQQVHLGGLWEFPGGKCEVGEAPYHALQRELREELDIVVEQAAPLCQFDYDYPQDNRYVTLDFWKVTTFSGQAKGLEGQPVRWVALHELTDYAFPQANRSVVAKLLEEQSV